MLFAYSGRYEGEDMEISRKTDYALRMLAELVSRPDEIISVRVAAEHNCIPYPFARAIQHDLTHSGIIDSTRGARGGMRLAIDPAATTLLDIIEAIQGPVTVFECFSAPEDDEAACPHVGACGFVPLWAHAGSLLRNYFASITLEQAVAEGSFVREDSSDE